MWRDGAIFGTCAHIGQNTGGHNPYPPWGAQLEATLNLNGYAYETKRIQGLGITLGAVAVVGLYPFCLAGIQSDTGGDYVRCTVPEW